MKTLDFKPVKLGLEVDPVSYPVHVEIHFLNLGRLFIYFWKLLLFYNSCFSVLHKTFLFVSPCRLSAVLIKKEFSLGPILQQRKSFSFLSVKQPTQHNSPQDSMCSFSEELTFSQYPEQDSTQDYHHADEVQVPTNGTYISYHFDNKQ